MRTVPFKARSRYHVATMTDNLKLPRYILLADQMDYLQLRFDRLSDQRFNGSTGQLFLDPTRRILVLTRPGLRLTIADKKSDPISPPYVTIAYMFHELKQFQAVNGNTIQKTNSLKLVFSILNNIINYLRYNIN